MLRQPRRDRARIGEVTASAVPVNPNAATAISAVAPTMTTTIQ